MSEPNYIKPNDQIDYEERQAEGYVPYSVLPGDQEQQKSGNGYVGVSPEYQNFCNETERPYPTTTGPEASAFGIHYEEVVNPYSAATPEDHPRLPDESGWPDPEPEIPQTPEPNPEPEAGGNDASGDGSASTP